MPTPRAVVTSLVLGMALAACRSSTEVARAADPPKQAATAPTPGLAKLQLSTDNMVRFVGETRDVQTSASDASGTRLSSDGATGISVDTTVAVIESQFVLRWTDQSGRVIDDAVFRLRLRGPGSTAVRVTLGNRTASTIVDVLPTPPTTSMVVVDSFAVVEYRVQCAWDCPYVAYAPLLRLREATGAGRAEIIALGFEVPGQATGLCRGAFPLAPGQTADVNGVDPYIYNNDFIFMNPDGSSLPDGEATARAIVRDANGAYGLVFAHGPIRRGVKNPSLPPPTGFYWTC